MFDWIKRKGIEYRKLKNLIDELQEDKDFDRRYSLAYLKYCEGKQLSFDEKVDMYIWSVNCSILNIKLQRQCKAFLNNRRYISNIKQQISFIQNQLKEII